MSDSEDMDNFLENAEIENGHFSETQYSSDRESDENADAGASGNNFDTDLPTTHEYLGKLNNVSGDSLFEDGEIVSLLAVQTNTLVFPDFTLPLVLTNDLEINMMQRFTRDRNIFALLAPDERFHGLFKYGITMEIYETTVENNVLCLKARGRQRCKLLAGREIKNLIGQFQEVTVRILSEPPVKSPISNTQFLTLKAKRAFTCEDFQKFPLLQKYRKYHLSQYPMPGWVYDMHEICYYTTKILDGLSKYYVLKYVPRDPIKLSYWFVQNFQLKHEERLEILKLGSALQRLRLELKYLNMARSICCINCSAVIAKQEDVFAMSKDGVQSNYCNPGGHVYEIVTVTTAANFNLIGKPSLQFSWFPGYFWTIMQCKFCSVHLGWRFTSKQLKPNCFYGLAKNSLRVEIIVI